MTLPETLSADLEWSSLERAILDGGYELKHSLGHTAAEATFQVRVLGGAGLEATAKFHRAGAEEAAEQMELWQLLRERPHRNVSAPLAFGRKSVNGHAAVYVVLGIPDDKLSALAGERPLTEEEAREVLKSSARALGHLHANGLAHGCVSPDTILAYGDSIQLAGECVRKLNDKPVLTLTKPRYTAPESDGSQATAAADVWCLGATLFEALAQKQYQAEAKPDIAGLPLALLLRRCLVKDPEKRATLMEVLAILDKGPSAALDVEDDVAEDDVVEEDEGKTESPAAPDVVVADIPVEDPSEIPIIQAPLPPKQVTLDLREEKPLQEMLPEAEEQPVAAPVPVEARHRPMDARHQPVEARFLSLERPEQEVAALALTKFVPAVKERRGIRLKAGPGAWRGVVAGAAVVLMVAAVVWQVIIPRLQNRVEIAGSAAGRHEGSAWLTQTLPAGDGTLPDARRQAVPRNPRDEPSGAMASNPLQAWRVVLYSYEYQSDAQRRVDLVNRNHPGLRAHLFVADNGGPYLVVTGEATSQDHAQALRKRALQLGVPRAQVQEFTR